MTNPTNRHPTLRSKEFWDSVLQTKMGEFKLNDDLAACFEDMLHDLFQAEGPGFSRSVEITKGGNVYTVSLTWEKTK